MKFRRGLMKAKDLSGEELRRLMKFFQLIKREEDDSALFKDNRAFLRVHAIYLLRIREKTVGYVAQQLDLCDRQLWRWINWYDKDGLRGLLNEIVRYYGQCSSCCDLFPRNTKTNRRCRTCVRDERRRRRVVNTARESAIYQRYLKSGAHAKAKARYRKTEKGKRCRQREHIARAIKAVRES